MLASIAKSVRGAVSNASASSSIHTLPKLNYDVTAGLAPVISPAALDLHYNKHHATYVANTNKLVEGTVFEGRSLEEVIKSTANEAKHAALFNNSAQIWNHTFFFNCMKPGGSAPSEHLTSLLERDFGSVEKFREAFTANALGLFGAGWTWLCQDPNGRLSIKNLSNAGNPIPYGLKPVLTVDVWEHSYYLDHQNRRPEYMAQWWDVVDWAAVEANLSA